MKKVWNLLLVCLMAVSFTACGEKKTEETVSVSESGLEQTSVKLAAARDPQMASLIICALEKGYFEEEGLDVSLELFSSGGDMTAAIAAGDIPIGVGGDTPASVLMASDPGNYVVIGANANISGAQAVVVNPEKIQKPEDIEGCNFGYVAGNTSEMLWLGMLERYDIDPSKVTVFTMGGSELVTAFDKGEIDAFACWEPTIINAEKVGGERLLSASATYYTGEEVEEKMFGAYAVMIASNQWITDNPNTTDAILRALEKSADFVNSNREKAVEYVSAKLEIEPEDCEIMMGLNEYGLFISNEMLEDMEKTGEYLLDSGKLTEIPDYKKLVVTDYLEKVNPELVNIE